MSQREPEQERTPTQSATVTEAEDRDRRRFRRRLVVAETEDLERAAALLARGAVVAHAFANFYAITTRADADMVRSVNILKGRPPQQVGSMVTTPLRICRLFDWSRLPAGLTPRDVLEVMDACFAAGPFGFRGPAAQEVPDHLAEHDAGVRTAQ